MIYIRYLAFNEKAKNYFNNYSCVSLYLHEVAMYLQKPKIHASVDQQIASLSNQSSSKYGRIINQIQIKGTRSMYPTTSMTKQRCIDHDIYFGYLFTAYTGFVQVSSGSLDCKIANMANSHQLKQESTQKLSLTLYLNKIEMRRALILLSLVTYC